MTVKAYNENGVLVFRDDAGTEVDLAAAVASLPQEKQDTLNLVNQATALRDGMFNFIVNVPVEDRQPAQVAGVVTQANALLEASIGNPDPTLTNLVSEITALSLRGTRERIDYEATLVV